MLGATRGGTPGPRVLTWPLMLTLEPRTQGASAGHRADQGQHGRWGSGGGLGGTQNTGSEATGPGTSDMPLGCLLPAPPCLSLCVHPPCPVRSLSTSEVSLRKGRRWTHAGGSLAGPTGAPATCLCPPSQCTRGFGTTHRCRPLCAVRPHPPCRGDRPRSPGGPQRTVVSCRSAWRWDRVWTRRLRTPGFLSPPTGGGTHVWARAPLGSCLCRRAGRCTRPVLS